MVRLTAVAFGLVLSTSPLYAQETQFTVTVSFANIHSGPSTTSPIIAAAPRGRSFDVTRELESWVAVAWPAARNGVGYLHSSWGAFSRRDAADAPLLNAADTPLLNHVPAAIQSLAYSSDAVPSPPPDPIEAHAQPSADVPGDPAAPDTGATAPESSSVSAGESRVAEFSGGSTVPDSDRAGTPGYSVQVAAFPDLEEARTLSEQLSRAGYPAYLTTATVNQVRFHRVRVGPFQERQRAQEVAQRLETQGYQGPWVTK